MTASTPRVSVVVPCRNERRHIEGFLESVLMQEAIDGGVEIIVADGMSDDGTGEALRAYAARHSNVRVVDNPGRIVSTGLNLAVRESRGTFIARMDVHTRYAPDYLAQCLKTLQLTGADNVGGPWRADGRGLAQRAIAMAFNSSFAVGNARSHMVDYEGSVDTVYLGFWWRERLIEIGLFDEDLVRNQDDELNLRIARAGGTIWQSPAIISWYEPRSSLRQLFRQYAQYGYWKVKVIQKHRLPASLRHLIPAMFVVVLVVAALCAPFSRIAASILVGSIVSYGAAACVAGIVLCERSSSWRSLPLMPPIFACFHFGYGIGFLAGAWRFWLGRATSNSAFSDLTRT